MQKYWNTVQDEQGRPRYNASVAVQQNGVNSSIFSTSSGTAKANPLTTDATRGYFEFFAAAGAYDLVVSGVGFDAYTISSGAEIGLPSNDVTFTPSGIGAVTSDLQTLGRIVVYPQNFMTAAQQADVQAFTGAVDVRAAVQAAVDEVARRGGGTVFFPPGVYRINAPVRTTATTSVHAYDGQPIVIGNNYITLCGYSRDNTTLKFYSSNGGAFTSNWQSVSGNVWRGAGIFIKGGAAVGGKISGIEIRNLELDGGAGYTGDASFPANITTGDGWDLTHKAVWLENDYYHGEVRVIDCHIHKFRGELIYQSGLNGDYVEALGNELHDSNAEGFSATAGCRVAGNRMYKMASKGVENIYYLLDQVVSDNYFKDIDGDAVALGITTGATCSVSVFDNVFKNCRQAVASQGGINTTVRNNTAVDCGWTANYRAFAFANTGSNSINGLVVEDNVVICDTRNLNVGFAIDNGSGGTIKNVLWRNNEARRSAAGVTGGFAITQGFNHGVTGASDTDFICYGNISDSSFTYTTSASCNETNLSTTGATDVAKFRPWKQGNFCVAVYAEVITGVTNVTINVTYYNSASVQKTIAVQALAGLAVGVYNYTPIFLNAYGASESQYIKVTVTAGTANQVKVSAAITPVMVI